MNIKTTPAEAMRARLKRMAKRARKKQFNCTAKSKSVRAVSGGLPGLGKRG